MNNKLTKIIAGIAIPAVATLSGCMSSGRTRLTLLEIERDDRGSIGIPKEHIPTVSENVYGKSQIYQQIRVPESVVIKAIDNNQETVNKVIDSPLWQHYKNRK